MQKETVGKSMRIIFSRHKPRDSFNLKLECITVYAKAAFTRYIYQGTSTRKFQQIEIEFSRALCECRFRKKQPDITLGSALSLNKDRICIPTCAQIAGMYFGIYSSVVIVSK